MLVENYRTGTVAGSEPGSERQAGSGASPVVVALLVGLHAMWFLSQVS